MKPPETRFRVVTESSPITTPAPVRKGHLSLVASPAQPVISGKRDYHYLGPKLDIESDVLAKYEASGKWIAEPKIDGMWARMTVGRPNEGRPNMLTSRDANTGSLSGSNLGDLGSILLPWPEGTVVVGELEAATEWATRRANAQGYRAFHLFDVTRIGDHACRTLPWAKRRELLDTMSAQLSDVAESRFQLLPYTAKGFRSFYDTVIENDGEGVVLKRADSLYQVSNADGKADFWVRCKRWLTGDYVLMAVGATPSGVPTGVWGLYKGGKLTRAMQAACPGELLTAANVGVLVVEFKGWAKFRSGALRHASFVRVRTDKTAMQCEV